MESEELIEIEARLFEQEHRPLTLIRNYFGRKQWDENDPRRKAVKVAILWRILFSPGVIAATGGLIALLSLIVLVWQTKILIQQNGLILDQNEKINQQTYLLEAQRRSALQFEISEILNRIDDELSKSNVSRSLSKQLKSRIIAATVSMKPYRIYENDILREPFSYEKGQFFAALINSEINNKDLAEIIEDGNFSNMILNDIVLGNRDTRIELREIDIANCLFEEVEFIGFDFSSFATLDRTTFINCSFYDFYSSNFMPTNSSFYNTLLDFGFSRDGAMPYMRIDNTKFEFVKFTGARGNGNEVIISVNDYNNQIKTSLVNGLKITFDILTLESKIEIDRLVAMDSISSAMDLVNSEEHFDIKGLYLPSGYNLKADESFFNIRSVKSQFLIDKFGLQRDIFVPTSVMNLHDEYTEYTKD